jgi:hypothetical protein
MKPSLFKRVKRAIKLEFRRIRDEHRRTGTRRKKPPLSVRIKYYFKKLKEDRLRPKPRRKSKPHLPPLSVRINYFFRKQREKYAVVLSSKYLIITLNSTVLYLVSFFLIHFLTHLITGISAYYCEISTTINYTFVDFHIRYWDWTEEMVILVFSIPAIFTLLITLSASLAFAGPLKWPNFLKRLPAFTKKQRRRQKQQRRQKQLEVQVQRLNNPLPAAEKAKFKKRLSWNVRLFLLWTIYHSTSWFFSGMLYSFLFHRRFGYVIWYAFNAYIFDLLFSVVAFLCMVLIGYAFAVQFFYSGRMYLNDLNDRNRMPFVVSQAIFPFFIGTILTVLLQIPVFDPSLILLNFSIFFLLLPLPSRAARFDSLHFDKKDKPAKIHWNWIIWSAVIVFAIVIAIKIGIPINLK